MLVRFLNEILIPSRGFRKNTQTLNFMKIRLVGAQLFHADKRTDGRADITKLIVAFEISRTLLKMNRQTTETIMFVSFISFNSTTNRFCVLVLS